MFKGSAQDYKEQIEKLNEQKELTLALDYAKKELATKFQWNMKSAYVKKFLNLIERRYILAASTHHDEEGQIIREWLKLKEKKLLLVIVPRHPERLGDILSQIPLSDVRVSIRSKFFA